MAMSKAQIDAMMNANQDAKIMRLNGEVRKLRDALKEIAQLGTHYAETPKSVLTARKALGCKMAQEAYKLPCDVADCGLGT